VKTGGFDPWDPDRVVPDIVKQMADLEASLVKVENDRDLSDHGKMRKVRTVSEAVHRNVQEEATGLLQALGRRAEKAQAALIETEKAWEDSQDAAKVTMALTAAATAVANADWPTIQPMIDKAIQYQDLASLHAWAMMGDKLRHQHSQDERTRPAVLATMDRVKHTLDQMVPEDVLQARQAAQAAGQVLEDARERLDRLDFEYGMKGRKAVFRKILNPGADLYTVIGQPGEGVTVVQGAGSIW